MDEDQIVQPISIEVAKKIVSTHFPNLNRQRITYKGGGSFSVFTIGEEIVLRLSKSWANNADIIKSFAREKALLDEIRKFVLPHAIPDHIKIFEDSSIFDGVIWVTRQFNGKPLKQIINSDNEQKVIMMLGDFLKKLHSIDPKKISSLEVNFSTSEQIRSSWFKNYEDNKIDHFHKMSKEEQRYMHKVYENFLSIVDEMNPIQVITHGDFDHSNCMWNLNENHLQVIDCEDLDLGHAVGDFCTWYGNYGEKFLMRLIEAYQLEVDRFFVERVKFYWLRIPLFYFSYAIEHKNEKFEDFARHLLKQNMKKFQI